MKTIMKKNRAITLTSSMPVRKKPLVPSSPKVLPPAVTEIPSFRMATRVAILNEGISVTAGGKTFGLLGTKGFFLTGMDDVSVMALFFFMMVFMDTTATIHTGAMSERWSWKNFCLYGIWVAL